MFKRLIKEKRKEKKKKKNKEREMLDLLGGRELGVSPRIFQNVQRYSATLSLGSEYNKNI